MRYIATKLLLLLIVCVVTATHNIVEEDSPPKKSIIANLFGRLKKNVKNASISSNLSSGSRKIVERILPAYPLPLKGRVVLDVFDMYILKANALFCICIQIIQRNTSRIWL